MVDLWSLGGLSWRQLVRRTWRESWEDSIFGQAARLSFYHFLALFPSLLLLLMLLAKLAHAGAELRQILVASFHDAMLLLWFYLTSAAILIGGEMNSEIENAAAESGRPDARRPGERRPAGDRQR